MISPRISRRFAVWGAAAASLRPARVLAADADADAVHRRLITFDAQVDIAEQLDDPALFADSPKLQVDLAKMDRGGLDGAAFVMFANQNTRTPENIAAARQMAESRLAMFEQILKAYPERLVLARRPDDVGRIVAAGKHFAVLSLVNAFPLGTDLSWLPELHQRGLRIFAFVHAGNNQFADSSRPQARYGDRPGEHGGLTALGKDAVAALNRLGIIVDVSQLTPDGVLQAAQLSRAPVIASHSAVKRLVDAPRNLSDEELDAVRKTGGVVHIVAFSSYLKGMSQEQVADFTKLSTDFGVKVLAEAAKTVPLERLPAFQEAYAAYQRKYPGADVGHMADAIDYTVKRIGIDHVGVSTDMEHGGGVTGYRTAAEAPALTRELLKRGYTEAQLGKIWSGNFLRVWRAVEAAAKA
jgi:membrane dipeptidase